MCNSCYYTCNLSYNKNSCYSFNHSFLWRYYDWRNLGTMLENQAFGWLKLSIKGLGGSSTPFPAAVGNPGNSASIGA